MPPFSVHVGDRAVRPDRHERVVVVAVGRRHRLRRARERRLHVAVQRRVAGRVLRVRVTGLPQPRPEVGRRRREPVRRLPGHLQLRRSLDRVVLLRRDDTDPVGDLDDLGARDVGDRGRVDRDRRVVLDRVGAVAARTHAPPVQHPRDVHVLHVGVGAGDLVGDVDPREGVPDDRVLRDRLRDPLPGNRRRTASSPRRRCWRPSAAG